MYRTKSQPVYVSATLGSLEFGQEFEFKRDVDRRRYPGPRVVTGHSLFGIPHCHINGTQQDWGGPDCPVRIVHPKSTTAGGWSCSQCGLTTDDTMQHYQDGKGNALCHRCCLLHMSKTGTLRLRDCPPGTRVEVYNNGGRRRIIRQHPKDGKTEVFWEPDDHDLLDSDKLCTIGQLPAGSSDEGRPVPAGSSGSSELSPQPATLWPTEAQPYRRRLDRMLAEQVRAGGQDSEHARAQCWARLQREMKLRAELDRPHVEVRPSEWGFTEVPITDGIAAQRFEPVLASYRHRNGRTG